MQLIFAVHNILTVLIDSWSMGRGVARAGADMPGSHHVTAKL